MFFKQNPYSMSQCSFTMRCSEDIDANVFHVKLRHFTNRWSSLTNDWQYFQPPQNNEKCTFLVWIENHLIQNCTSKSTVQCLSKLKHEYIKRGGTITFRLWFFFLLTSNSTYQSENVISIFFPSYSPRYKYNANRSIKWDVLHECSTQQSSVPYGVV